MTKRDYVPSESPLENTTRMEAVEYIHAWNEFKQHCAKGQGVLGFRGRSDSPAIPRCHKERLKITARSGFLICCEYQLSGTRLGLGHV